MSHKRTEGSCTLPFVLRTLTVYEHSHFEEGRFEWARLSHMIPLFSDDSWNFTLQVSLG